MPQIPVLEGIYTNTDDGFRVSYPRNMTPVVLYTGISQGFLKPAEGIKTITKDLPGMDRGGINFNGVCYRVAGNQLIRVDQDNTFTTIGEVAENNDPFARLDYSFDYLSISSGGNLYLFNKDTEVLQQVMDDDLLTVVDHIWIDGYFMTTDGEFLVVTELNDPFSVLATKYGSSEVDSDPVLALLKLRNEPYALNRYTIEVFSNVGGTGFPFQRIDGGHIQRGTVGTFACCVFNNDLLAFVGGGRNEPISVWFGANASSTKIATREVDLILAEFTEEQLSQVLVESRIIESHQFLYIHLPDRTLVYDHLASQQAQTPVWHVLSSGIGISQYRARNFVYCYNRWLVGDARASQLGSLTPSVSTHFNEVVEWQVATPILYNETNGGLIHEIQLLISKLKLSGISTLARIHTDYSRNGTDYSAPRATKVYANSYRSSKRVTWMCQGNIRQKRIQRFSGTSDVMPHIAAIDFRIEPLAV